jgi:hypothetical protein
MKEQKGTFGILAGAVFAIVVLAFLFSGGTLGGKKTVDGDEDLPPVAMGAQAPGR